MVEPAPLHAPTSRSASAETATKDALFQTFMVIIVQVELEPSR
jgi:hypothetical protein